VITAITVVLDEGLAVEFRERDDLVTDADFGSDALCILEFGGREGFALCGAGNGPLAEGVSG